MYATNPLTVEQAAARKVVLVTGAAVRIGREIALHFARQGWSVAVHYSRSSAQAIETVAQINAIAPVDSGRAFAFQADLADQAQVLQLVPSVIARFGRLDVLVNNASRFEFDDVHSISFENLNAHIGPNLAAPIILARGLHQALGEHAEGAVVNLLDQKLYNLNPDFFSYTMSKAALAAATTMLAQSLAPKVRVVGVAPGLTLASYLQDEATFDAAHKVSILQRSSDVQDIAASIYFAATNRSMTGSTLLVDGGQHLLALPRDISLMDVGANGAAIPKANAAAKLETKS
jgi:NAD(P)-dependent dehydrogenase (short-subunit alcohol dehydrogenase family)